MVFQGASDDFTLAITETTATGCTLGTPEYNIGGAVSGLTGAGLVFCRITAAMILP